MLNHILTVNFGGRNRSYTPKVLLPKWTWLPSKSQRLAFNVKYRGWQSCVNLINNLSVNPTYATD